MHIWVNIYAGGCFVCSYGRCDRKVYARKRRDIRVDRNSFLTTSFFSVLQRIPVVQTCGCICSAFKPARGIPDQFGNIFRRRQQKIESVHDESTFHPAGKGHQYDSQNQSDHTDANLIRFAHITNDRWTCCGGYLYRVRRIDGFAECPESTTRASICRPGGRRNGGSCNTMQIRPTGLAEG